MHDANHNQSGRGTQEDDRGRVDAAVPATPRRHERALTQGLSHDLRAPLRAIDGFAGLLAQQPGLDDEGRAQVQRIREAGARMGRLLDALQELVAASHARLRPQPVDLSMLADWAGAERQDAEPQRRGEIRVQPGLFMVGDEHYLKRLMALLLDNAWKFSARGETVRVEVDGERDGDLLRLRMRDHGIGFDPRYADKLFQPFQRLHGAEEGAGSGLGLAIAQTIAERHGGRIRAESQPGAGSVFHVELRDSAEASDG